MLSLVSGVQFLKGDHLFLQNIDLTSRLIALHLSLLKLTLKLRLLSSGILTSLSELLLQPLLHLVFQVAVQALLSYYLA